VELGARRAKSMGTRVVRRKGSGWRRIASLVGWGVAASGREDEKEAAPSGEKNGGESRNRSAVGEISDQGRDREEGTKKRR